MHTPYTAQRVCSDDFRRLLRVSNRQRTTEGTVHVHAVNSTESTLPSVEVVARKRLIGKSAVLRNRVKRRLRGAARVAMAGGVRKDRRYLIVARESAVEAKFDKIVVDVARALKRLGCGSSGGSSGEARASPTRAAAKTRARTATPRKRTPPPLRKSPTKRAAAKPAQRAAAAAAAAASTPRRRAPPQLRKSSTKRAAAPAQRAAAPIAASTKRAAAPAKRTGAAPAKRTGAAPAQRAASPGRKRNTKRK